LETLQIYFVSTTFINILLTFFYSRYLLSACQQN
jgi:hypothetical protein